MNISQSTKLLMIVCMLLLTTTIACAIIGIVVTENRLASEANLEAALDSLSSTFYWLVAIAIFAFAALLAIALAFRKSVILPIRELQTAITGSIKSLDLTQKVDIHCQGEIGETLRSYNQFLGKLCSSFCHIEDIANLLAQKSEEVDIAARAIARNSRLQSSASAKMNQSVEQLAAGVTTVSHQTRNAKEMTETTREASNTGKHDIFHTVESIELIARTVSQASSIIHDLQEDTSGISDMAVVIHQIAEQTNLLALNAAIEAARAGEQGRGFAVVADEVRNLAKRTAHSTKEISKLVERVQNGTNTAVENMRVAEDSVNKGVTNAQKAGESIELIHRGTDQVTETVSDIAESMEIQQKTGNSIAKRIEQITLMSEQNSQAADSSSRSISEVSITAREVMSTLSNFIFQSGDTRVKLRVADQHPDDHPAVQALNFMSKILKERTEGRINLSVHANGSLGNDLEVFDQLKSGGIDLMRSNPSILNDDIPETVLLSLPFVFNSEAHMHKCVDGEPGRRILESCESSGLVGLAFYDSGARSVYGNKAIHSMDDMRGLKLRVMPSETWKAVARAMGAEPVQVGMGEILSAYRMGVIDAAENNVPTFDLFEQYKEFKYFSYTEHAIVPELIVFSKASWTALSTQDQNEIRKAAKDSVSEMRRLWRDSENEARSRAESHGVKFITNVEKSAFQNSIKPLYDQLLKYPSQKEILSIIQGM